MSIIKADRTSWGEIAVALLILAVILVFVPLGIIASLNTLFPVLAIPYTFYTWLSVVCLSGTWFSTRVIKIK